MAHLSATRRALRRHGVRLRDDLRPYAQRLCHPDRDPLQENNPWRFLWAGIAWGLLGVGFLLPAAGVLILRFGDVLPHSTWHFLGSLGGVLDQPVWGTLAILLAFPVLAVTRIYPRTTIRRPGRR